jgi:hypothetical protein
VTSTMPARRRQTGTVIRENQKQMIEVRKRVPATTGIGFTSVPDGTAMVTYAVLLNEGMLLQLAEKAARNASQRSSVGPLTVVVDSIQKINPQCPGTPGQDKAAEGTK